MTRSSPGGLTIPVAERRERSHKLATGDRANGVAGMHDAESSGCSDFSRGTDDDGSDPLPLRRNVDGSID